MWTLRSVAMATGIACKDKTFFYLKNIKDFTYSFAQLPHSNRKDLIGSRLWCITVSLSLSNLYPGSGMALDWINSWSLHPYFLWERHSKQFFLIFGSPGLEVIKCFSSSTQLSMKFILLINVKMPTTVGILTFISGINTRAERFKARTIFIF